MFQAYDLINQAARIMNEGLSDIITSPYQGWVQGWDPDLSRGLYLSMWTSVAISSRGDICIYIYIYMQYIV